MNATNCERLMNCWCTWLDKRPGGEGEKRGETTSRKDWNSVRVVTSDREGRMSRPYVPTGMMRVMMMARQLFSNLTHVNYPA